MKRVLAPLTFVCLICMVSKFTHAQDYTITTTGNAIVITDVTGSGEAIAVSESGTDIRFVVTPATRTYSIDGGATLDFTTPADVALAGVTSITIHAGAGNDAVNMGAFTATLPALTVNGGTGDDAVNFNGNINFASGANLDVDLQNDDATPGVDSVWVTSGSVVLAGNGAATLKASRNIIFSANTVLRTVNGNLTLEANQQATPTSGNFIGIRANFTSVLIEVTGTGILSVTGKGGDTGTNKHGIAITSGSIIRGGTTGTMTLNGRGGASTFNTCLGIYAGGTGTTITSYGAHVSVTGVGGGNAVSGTSANNVGVRVEGAATITAGGSGNVIVHGTGGTSIGSLNFGVLIQQANTTITSNGGNVSVTGIGGAGAGSSQENRGISMQSGGVITAGGTGTVTVNGTAGSSTSTGPFNIGIVIFGNTSFITSGGGNVIVNGQGGGSGATQGNNGIRVQGGNITAGGSGTVTVTGNGGITSGNGNAGVSFDAGGIITSNGGNVSVTGVAGGTGASGSNQGISFVFQGGGTGTISAGGSGTVTVHGTGGTTFGNTNIGVSLSGSNAIITSSGGNVSVTGVGKGNGSSGSNYGVSVEGGGRITAGSTGSVTVHGTAANTTGNQNRGINISGDNGAGTSSGITSGGGNVSVTGIGGGSGSSLFNNGVHVEQPGIITAGGSGTVTVHGTGGPSSGDSNFGVNVSSFSTPASITSGGGNVSVTGIGGGTGISGSNYGVYVQGSAISAAGAGTLAVNGTGGPGTGSNNHGVFVTQNNALIGSAAGDITVTGTKGANSTGAADVMLDNSGSVTSTGGGDITFNSTTGGTFHNSTNTDASTSGTITFANNSILNIDVDGPFNYSTFNIVGAVNLNNVALSFTGSSYNNPSPGETFTIIENDGGDAIVGTLNGLAEGDTLIPFIHVTKGAIVSYVGGTGNDLVLTAVTLPVPPVIYTWTGATDNDWHNVSNWSPNTVPTNADDVVIANVSGGSNRYPVVEGGGSPAEVKNLVINAGARITLAVIGGNMPEFYVHGDFTNNGVADVGTGLFFFAGASTFTGSMKTNGILVVFGTLQNDGNITITDGGQVFHGLGTIFGDLGSVSNDPITFERTGDAGSAIWNFWGSPVTGANVGFLGQRPHFYDPMSATGLTTSELQMGWKGASGAMTPGVGYIAQGAQKIALKGSINYWNADPTLQVPLRKGIAPYNLLGNPFPSAMDANAFVAANGGAGNGSITGDIWYWDDDGTGGSGYSTTDFAMWNGTGSAGPNSGKTPTEAIAVAQGFFVEATADNVNVEFRNVMRHPMIGNDLYREAPKQRLWVNVTNTQGLYNEVLIGFLPNATDGYDMGFDGKKMRGNDKIALYTKIGTGDYMIQALPELTSDRVVELGLDAALTGTHTLGLKQIEAMDETVVVLLEDRLTGTWQNLRINASYDFEVLTPGTIQQRFYLHFSAPLQIEATEASCDGADATITLNQSGAQQWNYILMDNQEGIVDAQSPFNGIVSVTGLAEGEYTLVLSESYGYQVTKGITVKGKKQVSAAFAPSASAVYDYEPVTFTNQSTGAMHYEWDFGDGAVSTDANPVHRYAQAGNYEVRLSSRNDDCMQDFYGSISVMKLSTGISTAEENSVQIFTFENMLHIKFDFQSEEKAELMVYDVLGKKVLNRQITTAGSYAIALEHAAAGSYYVQIATSDRVFTSKALVEKR